MTDNERAYVAMSFMDYATGHQQEDIIALFDQPKDIFVMWEQYATKIKAIVGEKHCSELSSILCSDRLSSFLKNCEKDGIKIITKISDDYPKKLGEVEEPPIVLFCKGDTQLLNCDSIAVVGSRSPTIYGKQVAQKFSRELALNDICVVSGLAMGIDGIAHRTTLDSNGKTIAVLGGGLNNIYPSMNTSLANEIAKKGLLVSEYRPSLRATSYTFPKRNRIIAGLSDGVLICEAGERSGSLHTKEYALNMGRPVFAVPGNITSPNSAGTNRLIKCAQCACVTETKDILQELGKTFKALPKVKVQLSFEQEKIFSILKKGECSFDELKTKTGLEAKILLSCLTSMQISGLINKLPCNIYSL